MSNINAAIRHKLTEAFGFDAQDFSYIESHSPTLVSLLNKYTGTFQLTYPGQGASFTPSMNKISMSIDYTGKSFLETLAHELGHATGSFQAPNHTNATLYSQSLTNGEGEAIYYEKVVGKELQDEDNYLTAVWEYGATEMSYRNLNDTIDAIITDGQGNVLPISREIVESIGAYNGMMVPSGQSDSGNLVFTYDEYNKATFLYRNSNLDQDYLETTGKPFYASQNGYIAFADTAMLKSLVNADNGFFNARDTDGSADTLVNRFDGGSALAKATGKGDLLYGGAGDDILHGNSGKDILIGGKGSDRLYGHDGDDVLGGNGGNDFLYGGKGFDTYRTDGHDVIMDSDGRGKVYLGNQELHGGMQQSGGEDNVFTGNNGETYVLNGENLIVNGLMRIEHFQNGDLGITLKNSYGEDVVIHSTHGTDTEMPVVSDHHIAENPLPAALPVETESAATHIDNSWGNTEITGFGGFDGYGYSDHGHTDGFGSSLENNSFDYGFGSHNWNDSPSNSEFSWPSENSLSGFSDNLSDFDSDVDYGSVLDNANPFIDLDVLTNNVSFTDESGNFVSYTTIRGVNIEGEPYLSYTYNSYDPNGEYSSDSGYYTGSDIPSSISTAFNQADYSAHSATL